MSARLCLCNLGAQTLPFALLRRLVYLPFSHLLWIFSSFRSKSQRGPSCDARPARGSFERQDCPQPNICNTCKTCSPETSMKPAGFCFEISQCYETSFNISCRSESSNKSL